MEEIKAYIYETNKQGIILLIYKQFPLRKLYKILPLTDELLKKKKNFLCKFVTNKEIYFLLADNKDIEIILEQCKKTKFNENINITDLDYLIDNQLFLKFKNEYLLFKNI